MSSTQEVIERLKAACLELYRHTSHDIGCQRRDDECDCGLIQAALLAFDFDWFPDAGDGFTDDEWGDVARALSRIRSGDR